MSLYSVADIHGRNDLLTLLIKKLNLNLNIDRIVFTGDYVDRGSDSYGVINTLISLQELYPHNVVCLRGNHEDMMLDACTREQDPNAWGLWIANSGFQTMYSYPSGKVSQNHLEWVSKLPYYHEEPGFFFSHAPILDSAKRKDNKDYPFSRSELTWTCIDYEERDSRHHEGGKVGVCGHMHRLHFGCKQPRLYKHYIYGDSGCGCSKDAPLCAINLNTREVTYATQGELNDSSKETVKEDQARGSTSTSDSGEKANV